MSEATAVAEPESVTTPEPVEPTSTGAPESTPSTDVAPIPSPVAEGATPPSTEEATTAAPQEPARPRTAQEVERLVVEKHGGNIDAALRAGDIELEEAPRLRDRVAERQREAETQRADYERITQAAERGVSGLRDDTMAALGQTLSALGLPIDLEDPATRALLEKNLGDVVGKFEGVMAPVFDMPKLRSLRATLHGPRFGEFSDVTPDQSARMGWEPLTVELLKAQSKYVLANPTVETEAIKGLKESHAKEIEKLNEDHKAAYNEFRAAHGFPLEANEGGEPAGGGGEMTYAGYLKLTEPQKKKFNEANPGKFNSFLGIK